MEWCVIKIDLKISEHVQLIARHIYTTLDHHRRVNRFVQHIKAELVIEVGYSFALNILENV